MPIKYDKLFALMEKKGINKHYLRTHKDHRIHAAVVDKLIKGGTIDTTTIEKLCALLDCQPGDIMEYVPEESV
ncbi:MAG: helix-turn-helix transcriptional regulator [Oscillospiraceae bacterium]|nr:helix-turn-helix transcriptional regulator [Oscillospiraceae bacterium]